MAATKINGALSPQRIKTNRTHVIVSELIQYLFFVGFTGGFQYKKTTDGGLSWSSAVQCFPGWANTVQVDMYYERWNGTSFQNRVHLVTDLTQNGSGVRYNYLDLNTDTLGTEVQVNSAQSLTNIPVSIGVALDGSIRIDASALGSVLNGSVSTDNGATFSSVGTKFIEITPDTLTIWPDFAGSDTGDFCAIYNDVSATEISVKRWNSVANTYTETAIATYTAGSGYSALNQRNGHIAVTVQTSSTEIKVYDVYGASVTLQATLTPGGSLSGFSCPVFNAYGNVRVLYGRDRSGIDGFESVEICYVQASNGFSDFGTETVYSTIDSRLGMIVVDPAPYPTWNQSVYEKIASTPYVYTDYYIETGVFDAPGSSPPGSGGSGVVDSTPGGSSNLGAPSTGTGSIDSNPNDSSPSDQMLDSNPSDDKLLDSNPSDDAGLFA